MSDTGYQEIAPNGDKFVVLENGRRYEVEPGTPQFKVMEFERYKVRTEDGEAKPSDRSPNRLPITELVLETSKQARRELLWRIGMPVSAIILALMAIPLSYINPRGGRSANMLIAILVYAIYSNMISVSQAWVAPGDEIGGQRHAAGLGIAWCRQNGPRIDRGSSGIGATMQGAASLKNLRYGHPAFARRASDDFSPAR